MPRMIHKQILFLTDTQTIKIPKNSTFLHIGNQDNNLCIWYIFDIDTDSFEIKTILIRGTGHLLEDKILTKYLGTVQIHEFVWHIFQSLNS